MLTVAPRKVAASRLLPGVRCAGVPLWHVLPALLLVWTGIFDLSYEWSIDGMSDRGTLRGLACADAD